MIKKLNINNNKIFLSKSNELSNCYVCLNETEFESPCKCNISLCNKCFINVLLNNGNKCSICKVNFNSEIIESVKSIHSKLFENLENNCSIYSENSDNNEILYESIELINILEEENINIYFYRLNMCFLYIPVTIFTIICLLNYNELLILKNILFGLFIWISFFLFINIIFTIYFFSKIFYNNFRIII